MAKRFLNIFFHYSGFVFRLKQKIVDAENWHSAFPYALLVFLMEIGFSVFSLPMYFVVSPKKLQERGIFFPSSDKEAASFHAYVARRRISLFTIGSAGGIFLLKVLFIGVVSTYLIGVESIFASTQSWAFDVSGDYIYNSAKIEVTGGVARLKDSPSTTSGNTTNSDFNTNTTGWTYADWLQPANSTASGARSGTGGNPGGYINVRLNTTRGNRTIAGYWRQSFVTTVNSPDTATLNLDWKTITFTSPNAPVTYQLYAFIDTASGIPTLGQQVWSSGEITGATNWASISAVNIASKIPTAGTYYLKIAAYVTTPSPNATYNYISGFDNVIVNWSKTAHAYASDRPSIEPVASLNPVAVNSWNSLAETATKNGGEIYYQLSSDDGVNWKYWTGSIWGNATTSTESNTATIINTNIGTFTTSTNKIKWKAFLAGNGSQQVILDNIAIDYTENSRPTIASISPAQNTADGSTIISYNLVDAESDQSSLTAYEYSTNTADWFTMTASTTDPLHSGISGLSASPAGVPHKFVWYGRADLSGSYSAAAQIRMRANDNIGNGAYTTSSAFVIDYVAPVVNNITVSEIPGSTDVRVTYDLSDDTNDNLTVDFSVSGDGGSSFSVPSASSTGAFGSGVTAGTGKTIIWHAGSDYAGQEQSNMQVRVRAMDKFQNQGSYANSANFSLDTLAPSVNSQANLVAQPNAGDTAVLVSGSFSESNPSTNTFYVTINGGSYGSGTLGTVNTASPSNQSTAVGATLTGIDYISKVKITHTDDYGQSIDNENISPNSSFAYVKPYTPQTPTLANPASGNLDLTINVNVNEASGLEYAIFEASTTQYVQSDGTLGASAVWQTLGTGSGQWGNGSGISGKVNVHGLSSPITFYGFKVKSRNVSDSSHNPNSESGLSAAGSIGNTAPFISINSASQASGAGYAVINYTGADAQGDANNLTVYEYSTDNSVWHAMTEKNGVGSSGTSNLIFSGSGIVYTFAWDILNDLPNTEAPAVYARLKSSDGLSESNEAVSSAFPVDTKGPIVSNIIGSQVSASDIVNVNYDLSDATGADNVVLMQISEDSGATWSVVATNASGDVGSGVSAGANRLINWNAGLDFANQEQSDMQARIRATDAFGNVGDFIASANFSLDTKPPVVSDVIAAQISGSDNVAVNYSFSDGASGGHYVDIGISEDGGTTWMVVTTTLSGDVGSGVATGSKSFIWNAGIDFAGQYKTEMKVRVRARDYFSNQGSYAESSNFAIDTSAPTLSGVSAVQAVGGRLVNMAYDIFDNTSSDIFTSADISDDGGVTWDVSTSTFSGNIGSGQTSGTGKAISWNAGTDFNNKEKSNMRVRIRATDAFGNASASFSSSDFTGDTLAPSGVTGLIKILSTESTMALSWSGGVIDANFNHYELWYGANENDVNNAGGTANKWSISNDSSLSNILTNSTVITGLTAGNYFVKIFAVDNFGNTATADRISVSILAPVVSQPFVSVQPEPSGRGGGGGGVGVSPPVPTVEKPVLTGVLTPTNKERVSVSGFSTPGTYIDLYDNGVLVGRLEKSSQRGSASLEARQALGGNEKTGSFSQIFSFSEGDHLLSVRAVDPNGFVSEFSDAVSLIIDITPPPAPFIVRPLDGSAISDAAATIIGASEADSSQEIILDGKDKFIVEADPNGSWQLNLPSEFALKIGAHMLSAKSRDLAGNVSGDVLLNFAITGVPAISVKQELPVSQAIGAISAGTEIIREVSKAVELQGLKPPEVVIAGATSESGVATNDIIPFSGTALPNEEVVVYIHSDQAVVYHTRADSNGIWKIEHSQKLTELAPGQHTIFAVGLDAASNIKSRPGQIKTFTIEKSFWVMLFQYLNLYTTVIALAIIVLAAGWLYKVQRGRAIAV